MNAEDKLNKRLDGELDMLENQLGYIVQASHLRHVTKDSDGKLVPKDKYKIAQEHQLMESAASNIVHAAESLLTLTAELKQALLLNDFLTLNRAVRGRFLTLRNHEKGCKEVLETVRGEMKDLTREMEELMY
ncbi:hypothetical protein HDV05_003799 [Chytridiales sp. JEL 0842]|nr:hypothetical protein HDV05_003799 [Chytridiales sp. JEL 0842]